MRTQTPNQMPFCTSKHYRHARVALRTPLLSIGQPARVSFATWESAGRGEHSHGGMQKRERVSVDLRKRSDGIDLVRLSDAPVFNYLISRFLHASDRAHGCAVSWLQLPTPEILAHLSLPPSAEQSVVESLRRITNTLVTVTRRSRPIYPPAARLIDITRDTSGDFGLTLSTWLEDELVAREVCQAPMSSNLAGIRQRIYGWMVAWVGREQGDGRVIWQREILERLGPLGTGAGDPWDAVCDIVRADDLPDFHLMLTSDRGDPAVYIHPRKGRPSRERRGACPEGFAEIGLELDGADEDPSEAPPPLREIGLYDQWDAIT